MKQACGKIIAFGEHAVVYGKSGIAFPVQDLTTRVLITKSSRVIYATDRVLFDEEKINLDKLIEFIFEKLELPKKAKLNIKSDLPVGSGLGSSAALTIAILRALNDYLKLHLTLDDIRLLSFECEKIFHGNPSGIDNTVIAYEKPIFFNAGESESIDIKKEMSLIIANSGPRPETKKIVDEIKEKYYDDEVKYNHIFYEIDKITKKARTAIEKGFIKELGKLMTKNHEFLHQLGVSTSKLDLLCEVAKQNGAYGAKLSGAGKGGNMIALINENDKDKIMDELKHLSNEVYYTQIK